MVAQSQDLGLVVVNNEVKVSSRKIAEGFGKEHYNVIRDILALECSEEFHGLNFEAKKIKVLNNPSGEEVAEYLVTQDGFMFLVLGYRGAKAAKIKEAYINAFNAMKKQLQSVGIPLPIEMNQLDMIIALATNQKEQQQTLTLVRQEITEVKAHQSHGRITTEQADQLYTAAATRLRKLGYTMVNIRFILKDLKDRFLPATSKRVLTFKDIPFGKFDEALADVQTWLPGEHQEPWMQKRSR